jgi:L-lactate dehydrogenase complex protein LldE
MIRHGYAELFADDPVWLERAKALAERTYEFTEFLVDVLGVTQLGAHFPGTLTYHPSCHLLRELSVDRQPRALLKGIQGAKIVKLPHAEECCGFGGVFAVNHPELSTAMLKRKIANIENSQAPVCVTCDAGCLMHIQGGLHHQGKSQQVVHIAEILSHSNPDLPTFTKLENQMAPANTPHRK